MRKINLLLVFVLLLSASSFSQNVIKLTRTSFSFLRIDTFSGGAIQISGNADSFYNASLSVIYGPITWKARINSTLVSSSKFSATDSLIAGDSLTPNLRKPVGFNIVIDTPPTGGYVVGPNLIVIWPVYNGGLSPVDSVVINANYYPLGLQESPLAKMFIFQNSGQLNVSFGESENLVQQVRIYDILGQNVYSGSADRSKNIPTEGWNRGIYLCEINTFSGEKRTFKFRVE